MKWWRRFKQAWRMASPGRSVLLYHTYADAHAMVHLPSIVGTVEMREGDQLLVVLVKAS
jgi:hypothetical protein